MYLGICVLNSELLTVWSCQRIYLGDFLQLRDSDFLLYFGQTLVDNKLELEKVVWCVHVSEILKIYVSRHNAGLYRYAKIMASVRVQP
jgi:hypothetical protein